jgi:hypothetical protein
MQRLVRFYLLTSIHRRAADILRKTLIAGQRTQLLRTLVAATTAKVVVLQRRVRFKAVLREAQLSILKKLFDDVDKGVRIKNQIVRLEKKNKDWIAQTVSMNKLRLGRLAMDDSEGTSRLKPLPVHGTLSRGRLYEVVLKISPRVRDRVLSDDLTRRWHSHCRATTIWEQQELMQVVECLRQEHDSVATRQELRDMAMQIRRKGRMPAFMKKHDLLAEHPPVFMRFLDKASLLGLVEISVLEMQRTYGQGYAPDVALPPFCIEETKARASVSDARFIDKLAAWDKVEPHGATLFAC